MNMSPISSENSSPGTVNIQPLSSIPGPVNSRSKTSFLTPRKHHSTLFATFNVRSLTSDLKLSLLANTLHEYNISVCGLTEVRRIDSGSRTVTHPDVPRPSELLWSGHDSLKQYGVGLLLSASARRSLSDWAPISSRIIRARFVTAKARLTIIYVYAPTIAHPDADYRSFYADLDSQIRNTPSHDMLLVVGDFNAHLGTDRQNFQSILGPHSNPAPRNASGVRLLDFCQKNHLSISNSYHRHKPIHRDSFTSPDGKFHHMLNLVLVNHRFRTSILDTRVRRHARSFVESDHQLVVCKLRLKLRTFNKTQRLPPIDSDRLTHDNATRNAFSNMMNEQLPQLPLLPRQPDLHRDPEHIWNTFKDTVIESARKTCGSRRSRPTPWITPHLLSLISEKANAFEKWQQSKSTADHNVYKSIRNRTKIRVDTVNNPGRRN